MRTDPAVGVDSMEQGGGSDTHTHPTTTTTTTTTPATSTPSTTPSTTPTTPAPAEGHLELSHAPQDDSPPRTTSEPSSPRAAQVPSASVPLQRRRTIAITALPWPGTAPPIPVVSAGSERPLSRWRRFSATSTPMTRVPKYLAQLRTELGVRRDALARLHKQEEEHRLQAWKELAQLRGWCVTDLVPLSREHAHLRLVMIQLQIAMETTKMKVLDEKIQEVERAPDFAWQEPIADLLRVPPLCRREKALKELEDLRRKLQSVAEKVVHSLRPYDTSDVAVRMKQLLRQTEVREENRLIGYHCERSDLQMRFNRIIMDSRTREGQYIRAWIRELRHKRLSATDINFFVDDLVRVVCHRYDAYDVEPKVRLYLSRLLYPKVFLLFDDKEGSAIAKEKDAHFRRQVSWLRSQAPETFGVDSKLCLQPEGADDPPIGPLHCLPPLQPAVDTLEDLSFGLVPTDMHYTVLQTARSIYNISSSSSPTSLQIGADLFFPVLVYVTIHADLPNVHSALRFARLFAGERERVTELGYYMTSLEGAITYIDSITEGKLAH